MNSFLDHLPKDPQLKIMFLGLSLIFASMPGIAILWKGIGTPPESQYLFAGVIEVFGTLAILIILTLRSTIRKSPSSKILKLAILFAVLGFLLTIVYLVLFKFCVVSSSTGQNVLYPLWSTGELEKLITRAGGRPAALERYGYYGVYQATRQNEVSLSLTTGILLLVYQAIFTSFTIAFGLIGTHKKVTLEG